MALVNEHFLKLPGSYLFSDIAKKVNTFKITHPKQDLVRLGIGDVTRPLPPACIEVTVPSKAMTSLSMLFSKMTLRQEAFICHLLRFLLMTVPKATRATLVNYCAGTTAWALPTLSILSM